MKNGRSVAIERERGGRRTNRNICLRPSLGPVRISVEVAIDTWNREQLEIRQIHAKSFMLSVLGEVLIGRGTVYLVMFTAFFCLQLSCLDEYSRYVIGGRKRR